ncbi:MAG: FAD:protein FMN transferase [Acidobacteria bacterium]|nr:FAD:protein FMN transferase [Acidobacteriota bacterium]
MKPLVLILLLAPVAARAGEMLRVENSLDAMGTTYTVVAYGTDRNVLIGATEGAFEEVRRLDRMLSNYRPESELSEVNRFGAERAVAAGPELFGLLSACVEYSRRSQGTFDITVGPLMKVWGFYRGSGRLPHRAEIRGALARVGYKNILLDARTQTVRLARAGVELDPGGVGKGYAVDRIVAVLKEYNINSALVTAGGSSIYALGTPPNEPGWKVKIRNPKSPSQTIDEVTLRDLSLSTSGNYEKFFRAGGKLYSHVMDPRTGYPAQGMLSVSVIAPSTLDSEVWAKPFYILGREWAARNRPKGFRVYLCEDRAGMACAWLQ